MKKETMIKSGWTISEEHDFINSYVRLTTSFGISVWYNKKNDIPIKQLELLLDYLKEDIKWKLEDRLKQIPTDDFVELFVELTYEMEKHNSLIFPPSDCYIEEMKSMEKNELYEKHIRTVVSNLIYFRKDNKVIDNIKDIELRTLLRGIK